MVALGVEAFGAFAGAKAQPFGVGREAHVGIVLSQQDAVFSARGKHAVRFVHAFRDQIVDENADVGLVALQCEGSGATALQRSVDACQQPLARSLLVARCAVYLTREEQAVDFLRFQRVMQLGRVEEVILDGIPRTIYADVAKAGHALQGFDLHIHRQTR